MGEIWWDMFCPECSSGLVGDTCNTDEEHEAQIKSHSGEIVHCDWCDIYVDFDSGDIIPKEDIPKGAVVVEGG